MAIESNDAVIKNMQIQQEQFQQHIQSQVSAVLTSTFTNANLQGSGSKATESIVNRVNVAMSDTVGVSISDSRGCRSKLRMSLVPPHSYQPKFSFKGNSYPRISHNSATNNPVVPSHSHQPRCLPTLQ